MSLTSLNLSAKQQVENRKLWQHLFKDCHSEPFVISNGGQSFQTTGNATIRLGDIPLKDYLVSEAIPNHKTIELGTGSYYYNSRDLRQLAQFCCEVADKLDKETEYRCNQKD